MLNRKLKILFFVGFLILADIPSVLCVSSAPIIYVSGDGSGDFNCNATEADLQINEALQFVAENSSYTTVYLKGPFTYFINDTLLIGSNTTLEGDSSATIKLVNNANWEAYKPIIEERSVGIHDIAIQGFTIDGNRENNTNVISGQNYYNMIHLIKCQNISVCNMYLTNNHGDGLKTDSCSNIKLYNNTIYELGHDALYASGCSNVEAYNNKITCRTNSGLRLYNTNHASFYDNTITSRNAGGAGIEIQKYGTPAMDDIEVYNNIVYRTALAGIWVFGSGSYSTSSANVHIHHNQIYDTGTKSNTQLIGGILSDGFNALIENNVIDGSYGAGIVQNNVYSPGPAGSGYMVTVRNNIITNTRTSAAGGNGYGTYNLLTDTHSFVLQSNCFYNNTGGDFIDVQASTSDIAADPQYADRSKYDYHLRSKAGRWDGSGWVNDSVSSQCIDTGYPLSDCSNEPEPNGNRINIGLDGNTRYASKSELYVPTPILPTANFSSNITGSYPTLSIQFIDASQNTTVWNWDFGDSTYSTQQNPTHTYSAAGTYNVNLTASNGNGTDSKLSTINVLKSTPTITWSNPAGIIYGTALSSTQLTASASVPGTFVYTPTAGTVLNTGTKTLHVDFTPTDYASYTTASKDVTINVLKSTPTITWSNPAGIIYGTELSSTQLTASASVPGTFVYTPTAGTVLNTGTNTLHVDFTPTDYASYTTASKDVTINVSEKPVPPVASFSSNITSGNAPLNVLFTDTSTGTPTSWNWNFGDGTTNSIQKNPAHTYLRAGSYTVTLTVNNAAGSNTVRKTSYITAATLRAPVAALSANLTSGTAPLTVLFRDRSTGGSPASWAWSFGDGTSSTEQNPVHTYSKAGRYTVRLTTSNAAGSNTVTRSNYIVANALRPPLAALFATPTSGSIPLNVTFTDRSTGSLVSWSWSFGDGTSSIEKNPVHIYSKTGRYTVRLTARNAAGSNTVTRSNYIVANALRPPVAAFSASPTSGNSQLKVTFTDRSTGSPTSWNWVFGDGSTSTQQNPDHTYSKAGKYTISLTARNAAGSNMLTRSGYISVGAPLRTPAGAFSASPTSGKAPLRVQFTERSTGLPTSWRWSFGDGTSSTVKNPLHTYTKKGRYTVSLTVRNTQGSNTNTMAGYITVS